MTIIWRFYRVGHYTIYIIMRIPRDKKNLQQTKTDEIHHNTDYTREIYFTLKFKKLREVQQCRLQRMLLEND